MRQGFRLRCTVLVALSVAAILQPGSGVMHADETADQGSAERELAERYAPVVRVKAQDGPCDRDGEAFAPMDVDLLLGNDDVTLRQAGIADPVVTRAPTAADLFGRGEGFYLDFNGLSVDPGCVYERDYLAYTDGVEPVVYAHVVQQRDEPGRLALQYWLYWYYNDWNNTHESDWEFIQIVFDAATAEEALTAGPSEVGYAQHEGGERADWTDDKLERVGDRPVVYASAGSHASYFDDSIYLGRRGTEGFGCDETTGPSNELFPRAILLPHSVDSADGEFAWLDFEGRWGERRSGPFNGPTGPATKDRWERPIDWQDGLRSSSVTIPGADDNNDTILNTFCDVVAFGSNQLRVAQASPARLAAIALGAGLAIRWFARRTEWSALPPVPLRQRRRTGQMIRGAVSSYWTSRGSLLVVAALYVPAAITVGIVGGLWSFLAGQALGAALAPAMTGVASAIVAACWHLADHRHHPVREALRLVRRRLVPTVNAVLMAAAIITVLGLTVVGLPWAIRQAVRYQFVIPVAVTDGCSAREALARSSELVEGRWWRTATTVGVFTLLALAINGLVQLVLLIALGGIPLWAYLTIGFLAGGLVAPLLVTPPILLYGDAAARQASA